MKVDSIPYRAYQDKIQSVKGITLAAVVVKFCSPSCANMGLKILVRDARLPRLNILEHLRKFDGNFPALYSRSCNKCRRYYFWN